MNFSDVENQLTDLPSAFKRFGPIFAGLIVSLTAMLARSTRAIDGLPSQLYLPVNAGSSIAPLVNINTAKWGWLDAIGKLYGIPRNQYETDPQYRVRLQGTLTAAHGTPIAITNFIKLALNLNTTITENFDLVSYQINFTNPPSIQTFTQVAISINWVRPAGVPFLPFFQIKGGLYLRTLNYFGIKRVTGSYLARPQATVDINLAANTDNPKALLPTTYISDPYVTGTALVPYPL
jgi:hypothetical protein